MENTKKECDLCGAKYYGLECPHCGIELLDLTTLEQYEA